MGPIIATILYILKHVDKQEYTKINKELTTTTSIYRFVYSFINIWVIYFIYKVIDSFFQLPTIQISPSCSHLILLINVLYIFAAVLYVTYLY